MTTDQQDLKIKEIHSILIALDIKEKLDDRNKDILKFIDKSEYMILSGYHNRNIILFFYEEVLEYLKAKEGSNCIIVENKIIHIKKEVKEKKNKAELSRNF